MAQLLAQGTNFVNFVGHNLYYGSDGDVGAVVVTEWDEPQAVIGSYLHRYAYPDNFAEHQTNGVRLQEAYQHGSGQAQCIQLRGEYLYVAEGRKGLKVYDVAGISNKGISQRIITAPFSELGQDIQVETANATCMALPTNQPINPERNADIIATMPENLELEMHPIYSYAFIVDAEEGLILVNVNTLQDGEPRNNNLDRALTWNANGVLDGARHITVGGYYLYITTDEGVVIVNVDDPMSPQLVSRVPMRDARASMLQFRYLFVTSADGLNSIDVTDPSAPKLIEDNTISLPDARKVFLARTYAYVAAGADGLVIVDIEQPENMRELMRFSAGTATSDANDVIVATTNASLFAYVADGEAGIQVIQLTSPGNQPKFYGFSPEPRPELIARFPTSTPALSLSRGLERDRAVDETGGQVAVFGRRGSRPLNQEEMRQLYLDESGNPWFVSDEVTRPADNATPSDAADPMTRHAYKWQSVAASIVLLSLHHYAGADESLIDDNMHLGVATCASSVCHGKLDREANSNVWLNEYRIWQRAGKHSGAYRLLENEESQRIADFLGLASATTAQVCLDCHADNVPPEMRGPRFQVRDGVGCEACHGGAGQWIESHAVDGATHSSNLAAGMYPTESPADRAQLCLSCHMGNAEKFAGHDIMGAGHPRLSFELEAFQTNQPAHFDVDDDYRARKGEIPSFKLWLAGQLESAARFSDLVRTRLTSGDGPYPELALYDCHACHHPMDDRRWEQNNAARVTGPGALRLQDQHLVILQSAASVLSSSETRAELASLQSAMVLGGTQDVDAARVTAGQLAQWLRTAERDWMSQTISREQVQAVRRQIAADAARGRMSDFAAAEQAVLALETLSYALSDWDRVASAMDRIFEQVQMTGRTHHLDLP